MKVKCYRTVKFKNVDVYDVDRIIAMPEPDEITAQDIEDAWGIMLTLYLKDGTVMFCPHEFIISIEEG